MEENFWELESDNRHRSQRDRRPEVRNKFPHPREQVAALTDSLELVGNVKRPQSQKNRQQGCVVTVVSVVENQRKCSDGFVDKDQRDERRKNFVGKAPEMPAERARST